MSALEMIVARESGRIRLRSPGVGAFTAAVATGRVLSPGQTAGALLTLGRSFELVVPEGCSGTIVSETPDLVRAPVGYGDVLYELALGSIEAAAPARAKQADAALGALVLRSPQPGRFYRKPAPAEPAFVAEGQTIEDGKPVGLIEVMKTFSHVPYRAEGGLPKRAKIVRLIAADGADVKQGDPLLEVEPA